MDAIRPDDRFAVVLVAAGAGRRLGARRPKQYLRAGGRTLLAWALDALAASRWVGWVQPVFAAGDRVGPRILGERDWPFVVLPPVTGGATRAASAVAGLRALPRGIDWAAVHDAARPRPSPALLDRVFAAARRHGAAAPAIPLADTVKEIDARGFVVRTPPRAHLRAVQTPQAARRAWFDAAIARLGARIEACTDDAAMLEAAGFPVFLCDGEADNRKITTQEDLAWLRRRLSSGSARASMPTASSPADR